jgi:hypothetical protein
MGSAEPPLKFSSERKIRKQMRKRGWTEQELREALATPPEPWVGKKGPALRYRHPVTRKPVVVDATTGEIFHVGTARFEYDK